MEKKQKNLDEFEIVLLKPDGSGERKVTYLVDGDGERFNLKSLKESVKKVMKERKEELKKVLAFGGGMTGNVDEATGFVVAWITRSIIRNYEKKNDVKLDIVLEEEEISKDQVREFAIDELEEILTMLKDDPEQAIKKLPSNPSDNFDGTEIFK